MTSCASCDRLLGHLKSMHTKYTLTNWTSTFVKHYNHCNGSCAACHMQHRKYMPLIQSVIVFDRGFSAFCTRCAYIISWYAKMLTEVRHGCASFRSAATYSKLQTHINDIIFSIHYRLYAFYNLLNNSDVISMSSHIKWRRLQCMVVTLMHLRQVVYKRWILLPE